MTRWILLGLLALAFPGSPSIAPVPAPQSDAVEVERAANLAAFSRDYLTWKEALIASDAGRWLVIAGAEVFPRDSKGRPKPALTMEAALEPAIARHPKAHHRFVFRVGEEGEIRYHPTLGDHRAYVGSLFLRQTDADWMISHEGTWLRRDGVRPLPDQRPPAPGYVRVGTGGGEGPDIAATLSAPDGSRATEVTMRVATGFGGFLVLGREHFREMKLNLFEIPGHMKLQDRRPPYRRVRVHLALDTVKLGLFVPAAIQP